jgi:hypothetical protein
MLACIFQYQLSRGVADRAQAEHEDRDEEEIEFE